MVGVQTTWYTKYGNWTTTLCILQNLRLLLY